MDYKPYPTGGENLDEYLRLTSEKLNRMPSSGGSTAARPPAPQTNSPTTPREGLLTGLTKMAGNIAMQQGVKALGNKGGDLFKEYFDQWMLSQNPSTSAQFPSQVDMAPSYDMGIDAAGGMGAGAGMGAGDAASSVDWSQLAALV